jgi:FAD/FMN-containing dehydrogenase
MTLAVEAGMTLQVARQHAAAAGLSLPILLGSEASAQIGGVVATNAGGSNVLRFGMARSRLLGLEVVLADGRIWKGLRSLAKDNAGYSLSQIFAGSEGTLGVITAAAFQLTPLPRQTVTVLAGTQDIGAALRAFRRLRSGSAETMVAAEYMSRAAIKVSSSHRFNPLAAALSEQDGVLFEWATTSDTADFEPVILEALVVALDQGDLIDPIVAKNEAERLAIWSLRDTIGPGQGDAGYSVKNDVSVPVSQLVELVERGKKAVLEIAPMARPIVYGHLGDGNLHVNFSPAAKADNLRLQEVEADIVETLADVVDALGGSFSAEHGIGQSKRHMLAQRRPGVEIDMMRHIKAALDPAGILNPGKVL